MYSGQTKQPCATCPLGGEQEILARDERIETRRARVEAKMTAVRRGTQVAVVDEDSRPSDETNMVGSSSSGGSQSSGEEETEEVVDPDHPPVPSLPDDDEGIADLGSESSDSDEERDFDPFYASAAQESEGVDPYKETYDQQKEQSRKSVAQLMLDGEAWITNVKVAVTSRESQRRLRVKAMRKERFEKLRQEAAECAEMYKELEAGWNIKAEKILPLELYEKIQEQQRAADRVLERKDIQIDELRQALDEADWEFEEVLGFYQKDIMLMGDRIDDHMDTLFVSFLNELSLLEEFVQTEETEMLAEYGREWDEVMSQYENAERNSLEERQSQALNRFSSMGDKYESVKEEMRHFRRQLEDDYRTLVLLFENYKFASLLNGEKLDYNLKVVRRRELENLRMRSSLKRAVLKYGDVFNTVRDEFASTVSSAKKEAKDVIKDANRLQEQNASALQMLLHMAKVDYHRFMDCWTSSEKEARRRLHLLLDIQEFIFYRMLGLKLPKTDLSQLDIRPKEVQAYVLQLDYDEEMLKMEQGDPSAWGRRPATSEEPSVDGDLTVEKSWSGAVAESGVDLPVNTAQSSVTSKVKGSHASPSFVLPWSPSLNILPEPEADPEFQRRVMKEVGRVIGDETGFLLEEKLRKVIGPMLRSERTLVQFDAVLTVLGIETVPEMQLLARYMIRHCTVMKGILAKWDDVSAPILESMQVSVDELPSYYTSVDTVALERVNQQISQRLLEIEAASDTEDKELRPILLPRILYCDELLGEAEEIPGEDELPDVHPLKEVLSYTSSAGDESEGEWEAESELTPHSAGSMDTPEGCRRRTLTFKTDESLVMTWYKDTPACICAKVDGVCVCDLEARSEDSSRKKDATEEPDLLDAGTASEESGSESTSKAPSLSVSSSVGSDEFLYIPPNDVLQALAEFLKEFNAKTKLRKPTVEESVALKLSQLRFPNGTEMADYWSQFQPLAQHFDSDGFWESLLQIFTEYHAMLKERNKLQVEVERIGRQNEELALLLRSHMSKFGAPGLELNRLSLPYCHN